MLPCEVNTGNKMLDTKINEWFSWNKNEALNMEIHKLLESKNQGALSSLFLKRLNFGTAGIRGRMGPGFSQMNELVIIQTAQGLLKYLKSVDFNLTKSGIVIGYDGRYYSKIFAELSAGIFLRAGVPVYLFSQVCPTPFIPFSVNHFKCSAGVMVTASHNPKDDNGYKVYWSNGVLIIPPHDKGISACIMESLEPEVDSWDKSILKSEKCIDPLNEIVESYFKVLEKNVVDKSLNQSVPFKITYTAMHGVGYWYIKKAFETANFKEVIPVEKQIEPDPDFPTVKFPNPEEGKSALELAFATANATGCSIILANDPDADRLAVAEKTESGDWKILNGNEIGGLLAWWIIKNYKKKNPNGNNRDTYLLSSTVSSKIVQTIAHTEGFNFEETLTGFKWISNRADELLKAGKKVLFGFEEAIGFMCGSAVLDKDGVSAAVHTAELAAHLYSNSSTLCNQLSQLYKKYGHHLTNNSYFFCHQPEVMEAIFERLRNFKGVPNAYPTSLKGNKYQVTSIRDLTTGYDSSQPDKKARLPSSKSSQMITFKFSNGLVATLRTSGTEPKLKYYTELCASPEKQDVEELVCTSNEMVEAIIDEYLQPKENGLISRV